MVQLVTKVDDATADAIDELIASGQFASRSEVVRAGLVHVVEEARRVAMRNSIRSGYQRIPETAEEIEHARRATVAMIAEESW